MLFIFQAMDGAGKDSAIKHVMRGLDPKATQVYSFKTPSPEELKHDFMWRCMKSLPERGRIGIFNRSYYEDVLVSRVHPELLESASCPASCVTPHIWRDRFEDIRGIERYLTRNGTVIRKIFLNVSKAEQRRRFLMRLHNPGKRWKFSVNDINERLRWKEYMAAYEEAHARHQHRGRAVVRGAGRQQVVYPPGRRRRSPSRRSKSLKLQGADAVTQGHPSVEPCAATPALQVQVASPARRLTPPREGPTIRGMKSAGCLLSLALSALPAAALRAAAGHARPRRRRRRRLPRCRACQQDR